MDLTIITGPTASGKTALSIALAKEIGGEIINADSMQVYQYMDIGTAKPTMQERDGVPHHLLDVVQPNEPFSVAKYCDLARKAISEVHDRGHIPIMVGGTGLYIDSVAYHIQYSPVESDPAYRAMLEQQENTALYQQLMEIDPESAEKISINDTKRIIRALEIYHVSGETKTAHEKRSRQTPSPYNLKLFAIRMDREQLYQRINQRVEIMFENGLVEEVKRLLEMGIDESCTSMQAIGYKETVLYLKNEISLAEAKEMIQQGSRRYAKRQLTWFRRNPDITWLDYSPSMLKENRSVLYD